MSLLDYIIIALTAALVISVVIYTRKRHKRGDYCAGCNGCCNNCPEKKIK